MSFVSWSGSIRLLIRRRTQRRHTLAPALTDVDDDDRN
jgi:hypothetical protein